MPSPSAVSRRPPPLRLPVSFRSLVLAAAALSLSACSSSGSSVSTGNSFGSAGSRAGAAATAASSSGKVTIKNYTFGPKAITVKVGTTVGWTNTDQFDHSVSQDDGGFTGDPIHPGASFSHTYGTPGTFTYHCGIHNFMTGTVTVTS
jgi:plastocyanin